MNITKRIIAIVLIIFLSSVATACTTEQEDKPAQTTAETQLNTPVYSPYTDELPVLDGEGDTVNICG